MALYFITWFYLSWYMKCGFMRKLVSWEGIHVSALRCQTDSNDVGKKKLPLLTCERRSSDQMRRKWKKIFSVVHKYETLSRTNTSKWCFQATKRRLGTVLNLFVKEYFGNRRAQNYAELVNYLLLPEIRLQQVTKIILPSFPFGFIPRELWCSVWSKRRIFP